MKKLVNPLSPGTIRLACICTRLPASCLWYVSCAYGMLLYYTRRSRRREVHQAYERLREVAGIPTPAGVLTRKYFRRQFIEMVGHFTLRKADDHRWRKLTDFENIEQIRQTLDKGTGLIVCTMHFGTNLLTFTKLERAGYKVVPMRPAFMDQIKDPLLRRMLFIHSHTLFVGESSGLASPLREGVRLLKSNAALGVAIDGDQGGGLIEIPIFGCQYPIRRGALEIARLARAPMVFATGVVRKRRFLVHWSPVCYFGQRGTEQETIDRFLETCIGHYEEIIRQYPECIWWTKPMSIALGLKKGSQGEDDEDDV